MLRVFEQIKEKDIEAKKLVENARLQAERIKKEADQKAPEVFKAAYNTILEKSDKDIAEYRRKIEIGTENELDKIRTESEKIAEKIEKQIEKKFSDAVDRVCSIVLGEI